MSAITQFPVVTGKALQTASRKAEEALRTAADQDDRSASIGARFAVGQRGVLFRA